MNVPGIGVGARLEAFIMWDSLKCIAWKTAWISGLVLPLVVSPAALAHGPGSSGAGSSGSGSFQSQTTRPAPQKSSSGYLQGGRYRGSKAKQQIEAHRRRQANRQANRHLVSAVGGAANVRPETYQQLGSQVIDTGYARPHVHHSACGHLVQPYAQQPYVVYLNDEVVEPPVYDDDRAYGAAAQPVQGPIYVVQPQPAPQVVHVPVPVEVPVPSTSVPPASAPAPTVEAPPRPTAPQDIRLRIHPADAQVYLDDEPLGDAAAAITSLGSLDPGIYVLEVTHENYLSQRLVFGVTSSSVSITIDLTLDDARRRARVK